MQKFSYAEVLEDGQGEAREREREALDHSIDLLVKAQEAGPKSKEAVEALFFTNKLWSVLLEDLADPENDLPKELRAQIISIGIFILKEADRLRKDKSGDFSALIEVSQTIREGVK